MFIVGMFSWWYGAGWKRCILAVRDRLAGLYDYFSFGLLLKTLFAPFRQISAGHVRGPLGVQMRAWFDRLISRCVGASVRLIVLVIGAVTLVVAVLFGLLQIVLWPLVPVMPVVAIVCTMIGWVPWHL